MLGKYKRSESTAVSQTARKLGKVCLGQKPSWVVLAIPIVGNCFLRMWIVRSQRSKL